MSPIEYLSLFINHFSWEQNSSGLISLIAVALFIELPYYFLIIIMVLKAKYNEVEKVTAKYGNYPMISVIITCYSEGEAVKSSLRSIVEQIYPGQIEIFAVIDGSIQNHVTLNAAKKFAEQNKKYRNRTIHVISKPVRGGRVSSLNTALEMAHGEIIMALDGDTSCDNQSLLAISQQFIDRNVIASSGAMRVRNARVNLVTRLQGLEYILGIHMAKYGLSELNSVNNMSGAFGFFRTSVLKKIGGWRTGSAEDLDLTTRLQSLFRRYPKLKIVHTRQAMSHTDAPESWVGLFKQRLRWDGDLYFIWIRRYRNRLIPFYMRATSLIVFWGGLLFNLIVPVMLLIYIPYILLIYKISFILFLFSLIYAYYFFITGVAYLVHIILLSERKADDFEYIAYIPLMPIYQFIMRVWTGVAIIYEIVLKTHNLSSMAPWWVLKNKQ